MKESLIYNKAFEFAIKIVKLYKYLCKERSEYTLSKQVLRSGTSIGANIKEGLYAQSKRDFLSKFSIALKECSETMYWLELLNATEYIDSKISKELIDNCSEINKILASIVKTTKQSLNIS
ncbi:four helix bundle protein [Clostridium pasteurianum]|uniref:four helix bundle protein n=1 Tax=Clostridium pasteurianum TaxID=1501 RepID=UPI002260F796|nr:four helix bundle protein [Clostridium pasteurianum]UZW16007.1 four helix bundle protein [Clostridium pasteurianum]